MARGSGRRAPASVTERPARSLGSTAGLRAADAELAASLRRAGAEWSRPRPLPSERRSFVSRSRPGPRRPRTAERALAEHRPRAILYSTVTAALLCRRLARSLRRAAPATARTPWAVAAPRERRGLAEARCWPRSPEARGWRSGAPVGPRRRRSRAASGLGPAPYGHAPTYRDPPRGPAAGPREPAALPRALPTAHGVRAFAGAGASKRIAPGAGQSSAAVTVE